MITSKKLLEFYIESDYMMNRGTFKPSIRDRIKSIAAPDLIMRYLKTLRIVEYLSNTGGVLLPLYKARLLRLGYRTGITIAPNVFGYGLVIPHFGTIVVGNKNQIGNYAVLHTCVCITAEEKKIGDGLYCSTGSKILGNIVLGDNITIGANAVVTKSENSNALLLGIPASKVRDEKEWYSGAYYDRVNKCEKLKKEMGLVSAQEQYVLDDDRYGTSF